MNTKERKDFMQSRVRTELKLRILELIANFKSKEEPYYKKLIIQTYQVNYRCPKCNEGYLLPIGSMLLSDPPKFPHDCDNKKCDYTEIFLKKYPCIEYSYCYGRV